ncbi:MAG TPA: hypothetical protein VN520_13735 [Streptomyces sp.]|uniref:hypothetical protein n=1 Tax=Streptomyces sp. TaxID=1931 RepID=UPI002B718947|nr:hypothetical protein [Streptomyces sp.]HWU07416.1 hypothetical protein [Streptomyces sp.]
MPKMRNPNSPHSRFKGLIELPWDHGLPVPELPAFREWTEADRNQWRQWWESPQASMWDDSFIPTVAVMLTYFGNILVGTATSTHQMEYRHLAGTLGLTAESMKRLGWTFQGDTR